ncbi:MAG: cysteine-rich small domain-containing protein [Nitrospirota bacterium]
MSYKHFINLNCEFLPCHNLVVDSTHREDWHSCLFCYCPLFLLPCPGKFNVLPSGLKDCSPCVIPHIEKGWDIIQEELKIKLYSANIMDSCSLLNNCRTSFTGMTTMLKIC